MNHVGIPQRHMCNQKCQLPIAKLLASSIVEGLPNDGIGVVSSCAVEEDFLINIKSQERTTVEGLLSVGIDFTSAIKLLLFYHKNKEAKNNRRKFRSQTSPTMDR